MTNGMRLLLCVSLMNLAGCASPLSQFATAVERAPTYKWGYRPLDTKTLDDTQRRLTRIAFLLGIQIVTVPQQAISASGTYTYSERIIRVDEALPPDGQVQVVAHELAHALQPIGIEDPDKEVFADAVAYLVTRVESDDLETFANYLGRYRREVRSIVKAYEREILWTAMVLRMELAK